MAKQVPKKNIQKKQKQVKKLTSKNNDWLYLLIIAASSFLVYFHILGYPLGKLDEDNIITNNLKYISNFSNIGDAFSRGAFFNSTNILFYRPLQNISFMFDALISGGNIWGFYFSNIVISILTSILLFYLLKKLKFESLLSFLLALFFSLNPLFTQSIAWAPSRGDLLTGLFGILCFYTFLLFEEKKNYLFLLISLLSYFSIMLAKESGVVFPSVLLLYLFLKKEPIKEIKANIIPAILFAILAIIYLLIRNNAVSAKIGGDIFGVGLLFGNLPTIPELFGKFFIPANLSPMPDYSIISSAIGCVLLIAVFIIAYKFKNIDKKLFWFSFGWFFLGTFPGMLFSRDFGQFGYQYLEHRAFMPSVGLLIIGGLILKTFYSGENKKKFNILFVLIIVIFAGLSFARSFNYKDGISFYTNVVETNPKSAMAFNNMGSLKNNGGDKAGAIADYKSAVSLKPDYFEAWNNLGIAYSDTKNNQEALKCYDTALHIKPDYAAAYYGRAISEAQMNNIQSAMDDYAQAIKLDNNYVEAYVNRSILRKKLGDIQGAINDCEIAIKLNPEKVEAWLSLAVAKFMLKDFSEAINDYNRAISLNDKNPDSFMNRGACKFQLKDFNGAIDDFSFTISIDPKNSGAFFYKAIAEQNLGKLDAACSDLKIASSLGNPNAGMLMNQICK